MNHHIYAVFFYHAQPISNRIKPIHHSNKYDFTRSKTKKNVQTVLKTSLFRMRCVYFLLRRFSRVNYLSAFDELFFPSFIDGLQHHTKCY